MTHRLWAGLASAALAGVALVGLPWSPTDRCALADGRHHAAVVVEHGNQSAVRVCVGFTSDRVTGDQLMQMSGLEYQVAAYGSLGDAVCQVDYEPARYSQCLPANAPYWAMFVSRSGGAWQLSGRGPSSQSFADGDALGWRYETGSSPPASPSGTCPPPAPPSVAQPAPQSPPGAVARTGSSAEPGPRGSTTAPPAAAPAATTGTSEAAVQQSPDPSPTGRPSATSARSVKPGGGVAMGWLAAAAGGAAMLGMLAFHVLGARQRV